MGDPPGDDEVAQKVRDRLGGVDAFLFVSGTVESIEGVGNIRQASVHTRTTIKTDHRLNAGGSLAMIGAAIQQVSGESGHSCEEVARAALENAIEIEERKR